MPSDQKVCVIFPEQSWRRAPFLKINPDPWGIMKWNGICGLQRRQILTHCDPVTFWAPLTAAVAEDGSDARQWHHWGLLISHQLKLCFANWVRRLGRTVECHRWWETLSSKWLTPVALTQENSALNCCCLWCKRRFLEDFDVGKKKSLISLNIQDDF